MASSSTAPPIDVAKPDPTPEELKAAKEKEDAEQAALPYKWTQTIGEVDVSVSVLVRFCSYLVPRYRRAAAVLLCSLRRGSSLAWELGSQVGQGEDNAPEKEVR